MTSTHGCSTGVTRMPASDHRGFAFVTTGQQRGAGGQREGQTRECGDVRHILRDESRTIDVGRWDG